MYVCIYIYEIGKKHVLIASNVQGQVTYIRGTQGGWRETTKEREREREREREKGRVARVSCLHKINK